MVAEGHVKPPPKLPTAPIGGSMVRPTNCANGPKPRPLGGMIAVEPSGLEFCVPLKPALSAPGLATGASFNPAKGGTDNGYTENARVAQSLEKTARRDQARPA